MARGRGSLALIGFATGWRRVELLRTLGRLGGDCPVTRSRGHAVTQPHSSTVTIGSKTDIDPPRPDLYSPFLLSHDCSGSQLESPFGGN